MSEMSDMFKLVNAMELAKTARVGMSLTYFDVIELLGELDSLKTCIAELEAENDRLQDAWFKDETICPDGSLKPKVSTLLSRIAERTECIGSQMADVYTRIAKLEAENDQLTAHDATERQDDKSSNDTLSQTFVYGKERAE